MGKDKEWLKEAIFEKAWEENRSEYLIDLDSVNILLDQLEEPELPVIPQFVADFIHSRKKEGLNIYGAMSEGVENPCRENKEVRDWIIAPHYEGESSNQERFARAWLDGYEVEKEKLYEVKDKKGQPFLWVLKGEVNHVMYMNEEEIFSHSCELTEKEIKDYDERFWQFAEEVTE